MAASTPDFGQQLQLPFRGRKFVRKNQRVERGKTLHPVAVEVFHELGQVLRREIRRPHTGVEGREAEIDGVGAIGHGRPGALPIAGRGEQFGLFGADTGPGGIGLHYLSPVHIQRTA